MRHRIRVPTRLPLSLSLSFSPHFLLLVAPSCVSSKVSRASKVSVPLSCRLEAATSATRPRDPRMWAAVFAYLRHISGVGCIISVCIIAHQRYHRWNITPNGTGYCWRIEFDSIFLFFFFQTNDRLEKRTLRWMIVKFLKRFYRDLSLLI